jgi:AcrR family transcriptional regulator
MPDQRPPTAREQIADAALGLIGDADTGDLLRALTPERLAQASGRSASTVRYHFGGEAADGSGTYAFQRRDLALAVVEVALEGRIAASESSTVAYHEAAQDLPDAPDLESVFRAIADNLVRFIPGPSGAAAAARERVHHLALAICDTDAAAARLLRDARARQIEAFLPVYRAILAATGRELAPGATLEGIADAVFAILDGHLLRLRFDPGAPADGVNAAVLAIFAASTRARGGDAFDPAGEILGR